MSNNELKQVVGKADTCELLMHAFAYPDKDLADAVSDGAFTFDLVGCLGDVGVEEDACQVARTALDSLMCDDDLLACMRKEYTRLYLAPGARALVFPYESAFIHVERGQEGVPVLFRTPITLDVETQMHDAGVAPRNARKEPCDSIFQEFEFLSFLYGSCASAIQQEDKDAVAGWRGLIDRFLESHVLRWMPTFMERTIQHSGEGVYGAFARGSLVFFDYLIQEIEKR